MTPIKGLEFSIGWHFGLAFILDFEKDFPSMIHIVLGPFALSVNMPQYWKNGIIDFNIRS